MTFDRQYQLNERIAELNRTVDAQEKIIASLKKRVKKTAVFSNSHSSAYYTAANLELRVLQRTAELERLNRELIGALENERQLAAARDSAIDASKTKSQFLANMSHEIRTPMNGVIGMTSLLERTELSEEQRDFVRVIRTSGQSLLSVINDILDFSKIEAKKLELEEQPFSLVDCIDDALGVIAPAASSKGLELVFAENVDTCYEVTSDITRLRQILVNLLSNAVKFTDRGEVVLSLRSEPVSDGIHQFKFEISDTGIGIPANRIDQLFDAFSQADASTTRKFGGTGLGLAISYELASMLGGELGVESKEGVGSTFTLSIVTKAEARGIEGGARFLAAKKTLIIGDKGTNRKILCQYLTSWEMEVACVSNADEALETIAEQGPFDLALIDNRMPENGGLELAKRLREKTDLQTLPVAILGYIEERPQDLPELQLNWLTKPIIPKHLLRELYSIFPETSPDYAVERATDFELNQALGSRSVLLVEDNKVNQLVAIKMLEKLGMHVDTVGNGIEALQALRRVNYDIVLMDMMMPEMDGVEATKRIRATKDRHQPVIIALTANAMASDRQLCKEAGMCDFLSKPLKISSLRDTLLKWSEKLSDADSVEVSLQQ